MEGAVQISGRCQRRRVRFFSLLFFIVVAVLVLYVGPFGSAEPKQSVQGLLGYRFLFRGHAWFCTCETEATDV